MQNNTRAGSGGLGCLALIVIIWLVFCGGCSAVKKWTQKMNDEPQKEQNK